MAPLKNDFIILIRILRAEKGYNAHQVIIEFPFRKWNKYALYPLIKQVDYTGTSNIRNCSGRKRSARTAANIAQGSSRVDAVIKARGRHNIEYFFD